MNEQPRIREGFVADEETKLPSVEQEKAKPISAKPNGSVEPDIDDDRYDDVWPVRVKLKKPIHLSGTSEMLGEITFREPTGRDINRHGNPTRMGQDLMFVIDERKMMMMMTALSGIMTPDLERMDARDWNTCAWRLYRFFLPNTIME